MLLFILWTTTLGVTLKHFLSFLRYFLNDLGFLRWKSIWIPDFFKWKKNPKLKNKKQKKKAVGFVEVYECPGTEHFYRNICHMC